MAAKNTTRNKHYDYYHLLSGADLPIKTQEEINLFFEKNNGFEFVQYDTDERLKKDKEIGRRTKLYHFLQNYRRRYNWKPLNSFFTLLERILLAVQLLLRIDRMKKYQNVVIKYGSQCLISDKITKECAPSDLVEFASIEDNPKYWSDKIDCMLKKFTDREEQARRGTLALKANGFDIVDATKQLENMYLKLIEHI